jgi:hypothetical protein
MSFFFFLSKKRLAHTVSANIECIASIASNAHVARNVAVSCACEITLASSTQLTASCIADTTCNTTTISDADVNFDCIATAVCSTAISAEANIATTIASDISAISSVTTEATKTVGLSSNCSAASSTSAFVDYTAGPITTCHVSTSCSGLANQIFRLTTTCVGSSTVLAFPETPIHLEAVCRLSTKVAPRASVSIQASASIPCRSTFTANAFAVEVFANLSTVYCTKYQAGNYAYLCTRKVRIARVIVSLEGIFYGIENGTVVKESALSPAPADCGTLNVPAIINKINALPAEVDPESTVFVCPFEESRSMRLSTTLRHSQTNPIQTPRHMCALCHQQSRHS